MTVVHGDRKMEDLGRLWKLLALAILGLKHWIKNRWGRSHKGHDEVLGAGEKCHSWSGEIDIGNGVWICWCQGIEKGPG